MATFKALARGAQLVLVAGPLLFVSLFFTWQEDPVDYGSAGIAKMPLDGWDAWGGLLALLLIGTVTLVVVRHLKETEMSDRGSWPTVELGLGVSVAAVAVLKSFTDAGSTIASYAFVLLAFTVAVGTYLDWVAARHAERSALSEKRRGFSGAA